MSDKRVQSKIDEFQTDFCERLRNNYRNGYKYFSFIFLNFL